MGVGIPGIRARLKQFGGDLMIRTGPDGTRLHAVMPTTAETPLASVPRETGAGGARRRPASDRSS
jgi:signal transduction histidine kinase